MSTWFPCSGNWVPLPVQQHRLQACGRQVRGGGFNGKRFALQAGMLVWLDTMHAIASPSDTTPDNDSYERAGRVRGASAGRQAPESMREPPPDVVTPATRVSGARAARCPGTPS